MSRRSIFFALSLVVACGPAAPAVDAAGPSDAGTDAVRTTDTSVHVDANDTCDVSPAPSGLPAMTGAFVILDADAGSPIPMQTGGDPTGVWRMDHVTIYTSPESAGMYDPATSSIGGTAWIVATATGLRLELALDLTLHTNIAGTIVRHQVTDVRGTYTATGDMLSVVPECFAPAPTTAGATFDTRFTAGATDGTLVLTTSGMLGELTIVLTGSRMAS